jgi:hypothetical protein
MVENCSNKKPGHLIGRYTQVQMCGSGWYKNRTLLILHSILYLSPVAVEAI